MREASLLAHPVLPLLVAAALVAVAPRRVGSLAVLVGPLVGLVLVVVGHGAVGGTVVLHGIELAPLRVDALGGVFAGIFALAAFLACLYGLRTTSRTERVAGLVTAAAAIGVALAGDLVTLFFWWEIKAVASSVVIVAGGTPGSRAAGLRYLLVHLVGGAALLAGVAWQLATTGDATFGVLGSGPPVVLIAAGLLVSAAAVPLHAWLPDAYPRASVAGTVLLSAFTTKAAVYALARGLPGVEALLWIGVAMALVGVVLAMLQDDLRRLLSYHVVSQVGFMVAAVGVGTEAAINGATAHAVAHILYKGLLLMGVGAVVHATGRDRATQLGGLAGTLPVVLALYLVGALSISGVPLFSGFVSKELTIGALSAANRDLAVLALKVAAVGTLLSTLGKLPYATWVAPPRAAPPALVRRPPPTMYAAMTLAALLCIAIGLVPGLLWDRLPHVVASTPFTLGKVVETLQLLGVAALGFWLLRDRLAPHAGRVLDVDWVYRDLPARLAVRASVARSGAARAARAAGAVGAVRRPTLADRAGAAVRPLAAARERLAVAPPVLRPTWWLGTVLLSASLLVVLGSLR